MRCTILAMSPTLLTYLFAVADVRVRPSAPGSWLPYNITFEGQLNHSLRMILADINKDKKVLSEEEKKTQEYDRLAFRLVSYAAFPLLAGYTVYSCTFAVCTRSVETWD